MKRHPASTAVEFAIGPHGARPGWQVARIAFDTERADHLHQIDAAISALVRARSESLPPSPHVTPGGAHR